MGLWRIKQMKWRATTGLDVTLIQGSDWNYWSLQVNVEMLNHLTGGPTTWIWERIYIHLKKSPCLYAKNSIVYNLHMGGGWIANGTDTVLGHKRSMISWVPWSEMACKTCLQRSLLIPVLLVVCWMLFNLYAMLQSRMSSQGHFHKGGLGDFCSAPWQLCCGISTLSPVLFYIYMKLMGQIWSFVSLTPSSVPHIDCDQMKQCRCWKHWWAGWGPIGEAESWQDGGGTGSFYVWDFEKQPVLDGVTLPLKDQECSLGMLHDHWRPRWHQWHRLSFSNSR